jgi:hypothetical protein
MKRLLAALVVALSVAPAFGQAILQGGPWAPGRAPMYVGQSGSQPIVQDSGPASGGGIGLGLAEQLLQIRSATNTYPAANAGTGQFLTNWCDYDGPTTNATGYHFLCMSPNAQGGGLIAYGAAGGASTLSLAFNVNGTTYPFPFSIGGILGPGTSIVNDVACWNNITGTLLKDCGAAVSTSTNNTWTGTNNFTGPFQINSIAQTFPASGAIVGTSDVQVLTNKSINAGEINSGTLPGAQTPILSGDVTTPGGTAVATISAGAVTNAKLATATQNTVKGAATSTTEQDLTMASCSAAGNALQWTTNTGFNCATLTNQTAGFGLQLGSNAFSISQSAPPFGFDMPVNAGLTANAAGSNLTINLTGAAGATPSATNPVLIPFRSTTLTTGTTVWTAVTAALSIVVPSGATLGTTNSVPFRLWIFAAYNSGTPELGVATCSNATQIFPCSSWEYTRVTVTAITGLATSSGTLYATSGLANDSVRIIGFCDFTSGLATVGAWASSCTTLQLFGPGVKKPGDIIQTISFSSASGSACANNSAAAGTPTAILQAITPTSSVNLIRAHAVYDGFGGTTTGALYTRLFRGSGGTGLGLGAIGTSITVSGGTAVMSRTDYDKPGTTSSTTYLVQCSTSAASSTYGVPATEGFIEVQEIMGALEPANYNGLPLTMTG